MIKVAKFGGSSLSDKNGFLNVKKLVERDKAIKYVVASAPGCNELFNKKITDLLYLSYECKKNNMNYDVVYSQICSRFSKIACDLNIKYNVGKYLDSVHNKVEMGCEEDFLVSRGEYISGKILAEILDFDYVDASDIIFFNSEGALDSEKTKKEMKNAFRYVSKAVVPGFYGSYNGGIKTFTRGGSDITGSIIAQVVEADIYENWTDVDGLLMADPKIIKNPKKIDILTYRELRELSYMGASVLHDEAVFPVKQGKIPINIRNTCNPTNKGTFIVEKIEDDNSDGKITGISGVKGYTVFCINKSNMAKEIGNIKKATDVFVKRKIVIEHIPTGIDTFCIICNSKSLKGDIENIVVDLYRCCSPDSVSVYDKISLIAAVGRNINSKALIFSKIFSALEVENIDIKIIALGISNLNIIIGVNDEDYERGIRAMYEELVNK